MWLQPRVMKLCHKGSRGRWNTTAWIRTKAMRIIFRHETQFARFYFCVRGYRASLSMAVSAVVCSPPFVGIGEGTKLDAHKPSPQLSPKARGRKNSESRIELTKSPSAKQPSESRKHFQRRLSRSARFLVTKERYAALVIFVLLTASCSTI